MGDPVTSSAVIFHPHPQHASRWQILNIHLGSAFPQTQITQWIDPLHNIHEHVQVNSLSSPLVSLEAVMAGISMSFSNAEIIASKVKTYHTCNSNTRGIDTGRFKRLLAVQSRQNSKLQV